MTAIIKGTIHYMGSGQPLPSPMMIYGAEKPDTVIFTGTAELIPVRSNNEDFERVDSCFPVNGSRLTLHIQHGDIFTFSKSAAGNKLNQSGCLVGTAHCLRKMRTQNILLANDLVQAIFRTDMRNHSSETHVDVWLLQPPDDVVRYVQAAFPGCWIEHISVVPPKVILAVADEQTYNGKEPHFVPLLKALYSLPTGTVIKPQELYDRANLTLAHFKEAKRNKFVQAFFRDHVQMEGRGVNTTYLIVSSKNAAS